MVHGQLLAICPHDGERFFLAQTTWLMQEKGGGLIAGVKALPGIPSAIAARPLEPTQGQSGKYERAFLLPDIPSHGIEATLVLPQGWFRPARIIELHSSDGATQIKLRHIIDDGPDFERLSFVLC
mgnify:CR=1 FL=1